MYTCTYACTFLRSAFLSRNPTRGNDQRAPTERPIFHPSRAERVKTEESIPSGKLRNFFGREIKKVCVFHHRVRSWCDGRLKNARKCLRYIRTLAWNGLYIHPGWIFPRSQDNENDQVRGQSARLVYTRTHARYPIQRDARPSYARCVTPTRKTCLGWSRLRQRDIFQNFADVHIDRETDRHTAAVSVTCVRLRYNSPRLGHEREYAMPIARKFGEFRDKRCVRNTLNNSVNDGRRISAWRKKLATTGIARNRETSTAP